MPGVLGGLEPETHIYEVRLIPVFIVARLGGNQNMSWINEGRLSLACSKKRRCYIVFGRLACEVLGA